MKIDKKTGHRGCVKPDIADESAWIHKQNHQLKKP